MGPVKGRELVPSTRFEGQGDGSPAQRSGRGTRLLGRSVSGRESRRGGIGRASPVRVSAAHTWGSGDCSELRGRPPARDGAPRAIEPPKQAARCHRPSRAATSGPLIYSAQGTSRREPRC